VKLRALFLCAALAASRVASADVTKPPKLVHFEEAQFPASEKAGATVTLQITIGEDGKVAEVTVQKSAGAAFDAAAIAAARKFVFEPAEIDGKPASVKIVYQYSFTLKVEAKTTSELAGVVRDRKTKSPIAEVTVTLDDGRTTKTSADGAFVFLDVAAGKHGVTLAGQGFTALATEENLESGKRLEVVYEVTREEPKAPEEQDDLEIVVVAPKLEKSVSSTTVVAEQGRKVPGTSGDVVKVVESMPGVGRQAAGSGALVVWGASPEDTRVYVDGVPFPVLYHVGGVRSVLASDFVGAIELLPGGYGATYGRGIGGVVLVKTKPLEGPGVHGSAGVDLVDASVSTRAALTEKLHIAIAGRRSHLDSAVSAVTDRDVGELFPIPRYWDGAVRLAWAPTKKDRVDVVVTGSGYRVDRVVSNADPEAIKRDTRALDFVRGWVRYRHGDDVELTPWIGVDRRSQQSGFGGIATDLAVDTTSFGLRVVQRSKPQEFVTLAIGADIEVVSRSLRRRGSTLLPPREGDVRLFGNPPPDRVNADAWSTVNASLAPYIEGDLVLAKIVHVVPGLRIDPYVTSTSRRAPTEGDIPAVGLSQLDLGVEPRLAVRLEPNDRVRVHAAWGRYRQRAQSEDLSAVFGNPTLPPSRAEHLVMGAAFQWTQTISAELTAFRTASDSVAVRSPLASPLLAEALVSTGQGRAYGAQLLLRKELSSRVFGWISWTILRSERRDADTSSFRISDYDQSHVVTALASVDLGRGFELGARVRYATGLPRTPVVASYWDARRDRYQPVFGELNSTRLPDFVALDVRLARVTKLGGGVELETYVDVQNVTNRKNAEEIVYDETFTKKGFIRGVPLLPVAGARLTWCGRSFSRSRWSRARPSSKARRRPSPRRASSPSGRRPPKQGRARR
jgi:TonB family protein